MLKLKVSSTVLPIVPVLSWPGACLGNLYLVLHGQLYGVLCFSFFMYYRAVGIPMPSIQTYNVYPVRGEF